MSETDVEKVEFRWFSWLHFIVVTILVFPFVGGSIFVFTLIDEGPFFLKLLPLPFFLTGLFLIYFCLSILLNKTQISIEGRKLLVISSPIYFHKPIQVEVAQIKSLKVYQSQRPGEYFSFAYTTVAVLADETEVVILPSSLPLERANSLKIKEQIEMMLLQS